ncbi:MAG: NADP-dependent oxidoreductase [Solirubrobacteraceae bacterium]
MVSSRQVVTSREIHLVRRPEGMPHARDFAVVETDVRRPREGEVLVRNTWMSLDPAHRIRMSASASGYLPPFELGAPLEGWAVGEVVESRVEGLAPGDAVLHPLGWREYAVVSTAADRPPEQIDVDESTPDRLYLGPLGWSALTPYVGLFDVAELQPGDVVFVSGAAGAVGSLAVQIAKVNGNVVVGSAGSAEKVEYVRNDLGADAAFCYRDGPVAELLRAAAPDGIDVYFDNVGGDHLQAALDALRLGGRVALCGAISDYNATEPVPGPSNLFNAVGKGLTLRGFLARMYAHRMDDFRRDMRRWLAEGSVVYPETVVEGLDQAPRGFIEMLAGGNVGKSIVRI